ncbi:MAG: hypothetical protein P9L92_08650 [Candidatus Electryonea clarkiae]|nr:hypothetical protein [Candidatus Electryonea clarkiae]MDP8288259.1 hypothetical protein [Candidatus Electryonea clarkiae]
MKKSVHTLGIFRNTALVIFGWISFISSFFFESQIVIILLNMVARVLP